MADDTRPLSVRMPPDLHDALTLIGRVDGVAINTQVTGALRTYVESMLNDPEFEKRARHMAESMRSDLARLRKAI